MAAALNALLRKPFFQKLFRCRVGVDRAVRQVFLKSGEFRGILQKYGGGHVQNQLAEEMEFIAGQPLRQPAGGFKMAAVLKQ